MSRFKTELCNNLIELGSCKYGDRCHYAHGAHELRQVSRRHPKYRTETCKNFELTGKCPFGPRCSYVHPKPDLDSMIEQLTKYVKHTKAPKPDLDEEQSPVVRTPLGASNSINILSQQPQVFAATNYGSNKKPRLISTENAASNPFSISNPLSDYLINLCVIAGATSHTISNTSRTHINQLDNHYRASFMAFILDAGLSKLLQTSNTIEKDLSLNPPLQKLTETKLNQQFQSICSLLSNLMNANQMKFCLKHQDILETVLPQVVPITRKECARVTTSLRWNCSTIDIFLDRSSPLAFTREAALVRSILNASMMYLVVKTCSEDSYRSCGCQYNHRYSISTNAVSKVTRCTHDSYSPEEEEHSNLSNDPSVSTPSIDEQGLSSSDLSRLDAGSPLRLTKSIAHQVCLSNAFASTMSKMFLDSDDTKALNKAQKIVNEDQNYNAHFNRSPNINRIFDPDYKDLAYIKWTKSAINLHNSHLGRQLVRAATQRRCRCHGLSGVCQYQTCWDKLDNFDTITSRLRSIYLTNSVKVQLKNLGTLDKPDLYLSRLSSSNFWGDSGLEMNSKLNTPNGSSLTPHSSLLISESNNHNEIDRVKFGELIYLYESPNYCDAQPIIRHLGTRGRQCTPLNNLTKTKETSKKGMKYANGLDEVKYIETRAENFVYAPGSCEQLCCNRGYRSELVLEMVPCSCRFKFCCKIDCEHCLHQQIQHYCL